MAIKTRYRIYNLRQTAPIHDSYDKLLARIEFQDLIHKGGDLYRMEQTPEPDGALTKAEEFLMLVYRVRQLQRQYFDRGRKKEDLAAALEHEHRLDAWNRRTRSYLDSHCKVMDGQTTKRYNFFLVVEAWRKAWKERMGYANRKMGFEPAVLAEMTKKCRQFEREIDKYIKDQLQLI